MSFTKYKIVQYPNGKYAVRSYQLWGLYWDGTEFDGEGRSWSHPGYRGRWARFDTLDEAQAVAAIYETEAEVIK